jgi:hypothetical protein
MLYAVILVSEILFWAFLIGGLLVRYALGRPRAGAALISLAALTTLGLLAAAATDLAGGAEPEFAHVVAAIAVAYTIVYARHHLAKADRYVLRRLGRGGDAPPERPAQRELDGWYRHARMWAIGVALLGAGVLLAGGPADAEALTGAAGVWSAVLAIDFAISFSASLKPAARRD